MSKETQSSQVASDYKQGINNQLGIGELITICIDRGELPAFFFFVGYK